MDTQLNETSLDTLCGALAYAMGIAAPEHAAPANETLCAYIDEAFGGEKADRIFMYNPDAIAQWIYEKYPDFLREVTAVTDLKLPLRAVMPSVTPVCFGTMYTGAQPEVTSCVMRSIKDCSVAVSELMRLITAPVEVLS